MESIVTSRHRHLPDQTLVRCSRRGSVNSVDRERSELFIDLGPDSSRLHRLVQPRLRGLEVVSRDLSLRVLGPGFEASLDRGHG